MTARELREKLNKLIQVGRDVVDAAERAERALNEEDRAQIAKVHTDAAELKAQIETLERQEQMEAELAQLQPAHAQIAAAGGSAVDGTALLATAAGPQPANAEPLNRAAFDGWTLTQAGLRQRVTRDHVDAMHRFSIDANQPEIQARLPAFFSRPMAGSPRIDQIMNAMSVGSDTGGGFTVPEGFIRALEIALLAYSGMREVSTILRTATGEPLPYPTCNDTSNEGELVGENTAVDTTGTDVSMGSIVYGSYEYSSKMVRVSNQLMRDSAFDIAVLLGSLLGERLGRIQNRHCTTGDGAAKPKGIVTASTLGITTAAATALAADEILQLIHSVDPSYRTGASFMMHDSVFLQVSLLKDGNGNYMLQPGLVDGSPPRIRAYPVVPNQHMASSLAASAKTVLFGALAKYLIREVGTMRLQRLQERFAEYNQIAFLGFMSFDGNLLDAGTNPVKYIQQLA